MTAAAATTGTRQTYFHDRSAPAPTIVAPSVFVAVRGTDGRLLLVRRCDSGAWELPGGRVDVGENAVQAAVRETAEEAGVTVVVTGLAGVFTDPGLVIRSTTGEVRQPFVLVFHGRPVRATGVPHGDLRETSDAAWVDVADLPGLFMEPSSRIWVAAALEPTDGPRIS